MKLFGVTRLSAGEAWCRRRSQVEISRTVGGLLSEVNLEGQIANILRRRAPSGWRCDVSRWNELHTDSLTFALRATRHAGIIAKVRQVQFTISALELAELGADELLRRANRAARELFPPPLPPFRIGTRSPRRLQPARTA